MKTFYIVFTTSDGQRYGSAAFEAENQIEAMLEAGKFIPASLKITKCIVKPNTD